MPQYSLLLPDCFGEDESIIESKGWLAGVTIEAGTARYEVEFYDPVRFAQTIADDVRENGCVVPENVVVVPAVTRRHVEVAVERLAGSGFASLRTLAR